MTAVARGAGVFVVVVDVVGGISAARTPRKASSAQLRDSRVKVGARAPSARNATSVLPAE